jgi:hypothetical protein
VQVQGRGFRKNKTGSADPPPPPGGPPVLGSLVWSAEGLPSTRNLPFRWPLPPTSPPQVIPKQGNVSRTSWPGRWVGGGWVGGGWWSCTSTATRGKRAPLRFFDSSGLVKRAVPRPSGPGPEGLTGVAGIRDTPPVHGFTGGQEEEQNTPWLSKEN